MAEGSGLQRFTSRPIFYRWWFWVALLAAFAAVWYLQGYIGWFGDQAKYRLRNSIANDYIAGQEAQQKQLENAYKNDPYGGTTPEETLRLFIQALEKKDYALASNYFIPEKVADSMKRLHEGELSGGLDTFVASYRKSQIHTQESSDSAELKLESPNSGAPYLIRMVRNSYTKKWLISEF